MSLLTKHFTPELEAQLGGLKTAHGVTLADLTSSGMKNPDSSIGVYAGDAESYTVFAPLLDPIIADYHGYDMSGHTRDFNPANLSAGNLDPAGDRIISTRIRVGRNLAHYALPGAISQADRLKLEQEVVAALSTLTGDLAGVYHPLLGMPEDVRQQLVADHFLFKAGDRFLEAAGINRDWPEGRGIFHSADKKFLVWVNEEDSLRIISMQMGGNAHEVFERLSRAVSHLEQTLAFAYDERLGYLSSCPTNLGTAMRASVHIKLPNVSKLPDFNDRCKALGVQARGIHGEHSEEDGGGVYDISNLQRLGVTEVEGVAVLERAVTELLAEDLKLSK